jgi:hypothetical protein
VEQKSWILFIYSLPSQPSRKRANIWRELKRLGAVYLRDGVAVLPSGRDLEDRVATMAARVQEYEGSADLVLAPRFPKERDGRLIERFQSERAAEYRELHHACVRFLRDVLEEVDANDFGFPDVDALESELGRLRRWKTQIDERDYFSAPGKERVQEIFEKCERAFEHFVRTAHERVDKDDDGKEDDVFDRLGGRSAAAGKVLPEDFPL